MVRKGIDDEVRLSVILLKTITIPMWNDAAWR